MDADRHTVFRRLQDHEQAAGHAVLVDNVIWQRSVGIDLWIRPLPEPVYRARGARDENFGLFQDERLAAVVSLCRGAPDYWKAELADHPERWPREWLEAVAGGDLVWLCTLAVARSSHGRGVGRQTVEAACDHLRRSGLSLVWLDTKPGFMVAYYLALQFVALASGVVNVPSAGRSFSVTLMHRHLVDQPGA